MKKVLFFLGTLAAFLASCQLFAPPPEPSYPLSIRSSGGTVLVTPFKTHYLPGEAVTLDAYPEKGYLFSRWVGVDGTAAHLELRVNGPLNIEAHFQEDIPKKTWMASATPGLSNPGALIPYTGPSRTGQKDQVFENFIITKRLYIDHPGVLFRNCRIQGTPEDSLALYATAPGVRSPEGGVDLTLEHCDLTTGIHFLDGFTALHNYIRAAPGAYLDNGFAFAGSRITLEGNLIDNLRGVPGAHLDGIQVMGGSQILIRNNWIEASSHAPIPGGGVAGAILLKPDKGPISGVTIQGNRLIQDPVDAYFPLRIYNSSGPLVVQDNVWDRARHGMGGPWDIVNSPIHLWTGNRWDDGSPLSGP